MKQEEFVAKCKELSEEFLRLVTEYNKEVSDGTGDMFGDYAIVKDEYDQHGIVIASITCSLQGKKCSTLQDPVYPCTTGFSLGAAKASMTLRGSSVFVATNEEEYNYDDSQRLQAMKNMWRIEREAYY